MSEPPVESADCIHHLFEATVARGPDAPAVRFGARRLTYAQLNRHANRLAHHLRGLGMGPERLAGVLLERSPEALIGILAVLKAGGAFLPLDPAIPPDRLAAILDQARPDLVLTRGELAPRLPPESVAVCVDRDAAAVARQPDANPPAAALPDHLAYVIFTSGSTGAPKGVMVAHRGLCNLAREYVRLFEISPRDRVLQFASLGFDASVEEMFKAWAGGAELHLPEPRAQLPGDDLLQLLRDQAITVATLPPSALAALPAVDLPALRAIAAAGERCSPDLVARWGHGRAFFNAYGPTEATVCATVARCHEDAARPPPIGRPLRGVEVLVLDGRLEPVPAGTAGDLYIGGVGLARGYLGQPGLTAERFIPHPHPREPGARLYRTGDRARFDADGALEFLGREDRQVKVRGHRVELEEIEAILERHPAVREAAVVAREEAGEVHLVAYAGLEPGGNEADLRSSLKATLPRFMLPSALVVLDALPRTLHGKVDHRRLPAVERRRPADLPQPQAPRTALERELVRLWESLLGVAPVGVTDDFFDLGGHSLLATRMMAQLQAAHGRRLSTLTLLQGPTIQALARALESPAAVARSPVVPLRARGSGLPFFCVHPVGGSVACYVELARSLGPDHPFLGLQSPGLDGTPYPFTSLEEIAADYLEAIRRQQPSGPYALGGWSNGGVLAFEMAQQLVQRGEQVALLALIDSRAPTPETRKSLMGMLGELDDAAMGYLFLLHLARLSQQRPTARLDALRRLPPAQLHAHLAEEANRFGALPPGATAEMLQPILHVYRTNFRSVIQYHPRPYAGALTLFRASEEVPEPPHPPPWGWETYAAGPFEVHDVGGNHYTAVSKTHSPALAQQLRRSLERAVERRP